MTRCPFQDMEGHLDPTSPRYMRCCAQAIAAADDWLRSKGGPEGVAREVHQDLEPE